MLQSLSRPPLTIKEVQQPQPPPVPRSSLVVAAAAVAASAGWQEGAKLGISTKKGKQKTPSLLSAGSKPHPQKSPTQPNDKPEYYPRTAVALPKRQKSPTQPNDEPWKIPMESVSSAADRIPSG